MNCCRCQKKIKTPNAEYSVAELVELCRPHCLGCDPESFPRPHDGEWHIDFFAAEGAFSPARDYLAIRSTSEDATALSAEAEDAVRKLLGTIAALDRDELTIMHGLLNGRSYSQIAPDLNVRSRQHTLYKIKKAIERHPWLNALRCREVARSDTP